MFWKLILRVAVRLLRKHGVIAIGGTASPPFSCYRHVFSLEYGDSAELISARLLRSFQYVTVLAACHHKAHSVKSLHTVPCHYEALLPHKLACSTSLLITFSSHSTRRLRITSAEVCKVTVARYGHAPSSPHVPMNSRSFASEK